MRTKFFDGRSFVEHVDLVRRTEGRWIFCDGAMITCEGYKGSRSILGVTSAYVEVLNAEVVKIGRSSCLTRSSLCAKCNIAQDRLTVAELQSMQLRFFPPISLTNNDAELMGMLSALKHACKIGGEVNIACDSDVTMGRLYKALEIDMEWYKANIAKMGDNVSSQDMFSHFINIAAHVEKSGCVQLNMHLVAGHPTKKDLQLGYRRDNRLPVSRFNMVADSLATRYANELKTTRWMQKAMGVQA